MIKRIVTYIGQAPWDVEMVRRERSLNRVCWVVIVIAVLYFAPVCLRTILRLYQ